MFVTNSLRMINLDCLIVVKGYTVKKIIVWFYENTVKVKLFVTL